MSEPAGPVMDAPAPGEAPHFEQAGPAEFRDPLIREELKRASVWFGLGLAILAVVFLAQPLLLIFGGVVFAAILFVMEITYSLHALELEIPDETMTARMLPFRRRRES